MSKCINCQHLDLRQYPAHAPRSIGICKLHYKSGEFEPINREKECKDFKTAPQDIIDKRVAWNKSKGA